MKILLIDDHKLFSQSIKLILELSEAIEKVDLMDDFLSWTFLMMIMILCSST